MKFEGRYFDYRKSLLPNEWMQKRDDLDSDLVRAYSDYLGSPSEHRVYQDGFRAIDSSMGYPGWNLLYYACFCELREKEENIILDIGTGNGTPTIFIAQALIDSGFSGQVFAVEKDSKRCETARENWEKAGVAERITLTCGDAKEFLSNFDKKVVFANLDTDPYTKAMVLEQFWHMHHIMKDDCIIFMNNTRTLHSLGIFDAVREIFGGNVVRWYNCAYWSPGCTIWQGKPLSLDQLNEIKPLIFS